MGIFGSAEKLNSLTKGYFFETLPDGLRSGYEAVTYGIASFQKQIQVPGVHNKEGMNRILEAVMYDNPILCYVNPRNNIIISSESSYAFLMDYIYDKKKGMKIQNEIEEKLNFIIGQFITDDMSDYEKCLAIHDYMTENIRYNFSALSVDYVYDAFTAEGPILRHQAVCEGISKAIALLLGKLNIFCIVVHGVSDIDNQTVGHAWNIVRLSGKYYHIDATWDLQEVNHFTSRSHMYMNLDDESILMNHNWELQNYPTCKSYDENYYVKEKRYFRTMRSFELYVQRFLNSKLKYMDVRFEDTLSIPDDGGQRLSDIIQKTAERLGIAYQSSYLFNACNYVFQAEIDYQKD